jgi:hypothetical protein
MTEVERAFLLHLVVEHGDRPFAYTWAKEPMMSLRREGMIEVTEFVTDVKTSDARVTAAGLNFLKGGQNEQ